MSTPSPFVRQPNGFDCYAFQAASSVLVYCDTDTLTRAAMFDDIDPRSPTPLYAQIAGRIRLAVAAGELRAGDGLPSVRQLAGQLRINPATVVQAYRDLASEGFVEMRQGAGTFVNAVAQDRRARERQAEARRLVQDMMREAARLGIAPAELRSAIHQELDAQTAAGRRPELLATRQNNGRSS